MGTQSREPESVPSTNHITIINLNSMTQYLDVLNYAHFVRGLNAGVVLKLHFMVVILVEIQKAEDIWRSYTQICSTHHVPHTGY